MFQANETPAEQLERDLVDALQPLRSALTEHEMYRRLNARACLRVFMESHVFAVWDFMCLLKTLQQRLTCVTTPWMPPNDPLAARLINQIVLAEESDEVGEGRCASHFDLYVDAMLEVGANTTPIRRFLQGLADGRPAPLAVGRSDVPVSTKAFVLNTLATANGSTHEIAASFVLGREQLIPAMFERVLRAVSAADAPTLHLYLERHVELDGDEHGPAGLLLLRRLCGTDREAWAEAERSARRALAARRALWDGVCKAIEASCPNLASA